MTVADFPILTGDYDYDDDGDVPAGLVTKCWTIGRKQQCDGTRNGEAAGKDSASSSRSMACCRSPSLRSNSELHGSLRLSVDMQLTFRHSMTPSFWSCARLQAGCQPEHALDCYTQSAHGARARVARSLAAEGILIMHTSPGGQAISERRMTPALEHQSPKLPWARIDSHGVWAGQTGRLTAVVVGCWFWRVGIPRPALQCSDATAANAGGPFLCSIRVSQAVNSRSQCPTCAARCLAGVQRARSERQLSSAQRHRRRKPKRQSGIAAPYHLRLALHHASAIPAPEWGSHHPTLRHAANGCCRIPATLALGVG